MSKRISKEIIEKVRYLRKRGLSYNEIGREIGLSSGSVYRHAYGVKILPKYQLDWKSKQGGSVLRKKKAEKKAEEKALEIIKSISDKEKIVFLSALYWGEGGKKDFNLTNTDPELIKIFVKGLREVFQIKTDDFRVSIRTYEDLDKEECLSFWSEIVGVPKNQFVNVNVLKGKKIGKLKYGMCRLRIKKGGDMLKYLTAIKKEVIRLF